MNESYVLGRNKTVFETAEFPQITADEKIGIIFDGDIESSLLAIIAKRLYGADRVVFINDQAMGYDGKIYKERKDLHRLNIINSTILLFSVIPSRLNNVPKDSVPSVFV